MLADHLWQSTLFTVGAALLTVCLRPNRAAVRYRLWFAASAKFLVPFSWLIAIGGRFAWRTPLDGGSWAMNQVIAIQPFSVGAAQSAAATPRPAASIAMLLGAVWVVGAVGVLVSWRRQWRPIRAAVSRARPLVVDADVLGTRIKAVSSPELLEPGVVGIWRPVLVLPDGIVDRLKPSELRAIVLHECCHVRRRDNLAAAAHMLVEVLFWFHPFVWWIEARLVDERERACDEDVLHHGIAADEYAQSILAICRLYVESRLACHSGVGGSNLARRIDAIVNGRIGVRLSVWKQLLVGGAVVVTLAAPIVAGASAPTAMQAPTIDDGHLAFDTASIRPNSVVGPSNLSFGAGGRFTARRMPLRRMMQVAFRVYDFQIIGNQRVLDDLFDVVAKAEGNPRADELQSMLRALLKDRFRIVMHVETRSLPVYTLAMARKDGRMEANLRSSGVDCLPVRIPPSANFPSAPPPPPPPPGALPPPDPNVNADPNRVGGSCGSMLAQGMISGRKITMTQLANVFARFLDRVVIDRTGLTGEFDVDLVYTPDVMPIRTGALPPLSPPSDGPSLFTAVREQLGLKLQPGKGPVPVLVIEHVEAPKED